MSDGRLIAYFLISSLIAFTIVQIFQAVTGGETMSQFVIRKAREGNRRWKIFIFGFPILIGLVAIWLFFHWETPCIYWGVLCWLNV